MATKLLDYEGLMRFKSKLDAKAYAEHAALEERMTDVEDLAEETARSAASIGNIAAILEEHGDEDLADVLRLEDRTGAVEAAVAALRGALGRVKISVLPEAGYADLVDNDMVDPETVYLIYGDDDLEVSASGSRIPLSSYATIDEMETAIRNAVSTKQNTIDDLSTIRAGAAAGATAYQKPATGIPASDLSQAVQTTLNNAADKSKVVSTEANQGLSETAKSNARKNIQAASEAAFKALKEAVDMLKRTSVVIEGYLRVAGSSDPALSYRHYAMSDVMQDGVESSDSVFHVFYPCLVGNNLTGDVGTIKHVLSKLGARLATASDTGFSVGQAIWLDLEGTPHAIDGSEGDVQIVNVVPYYQIAGKHMVNGTNLDVFLRSRQAFTWNGIEAEKIAPFGDSPDYAVAHSDSGTMVLHSVYNPSWNGSYTAPDSVAGKYVYADDGAGGITETYDSTATLLGGAGGCHTTDISMPNAEQYAMNMQGGEATIPYFNKTAHGAELLHAGILSEGGTFDAHKAALMGSGFSSNDPATQAVHWEESASEARNGMRVQDKDGTWRMFSLGSNIKAWLGKSSDFYVGQMVNSWRNPWKVMEAHRAVSHAVAQGVPELQWFAFEGNKYKWRSIDGFDGPAQGEMTCVVWKMLSGKCKSNVLDPTDHTTSIEGNRIDFLFSTAMWHGITTQVSPSWWTSGLLFTEDDGQNYECYIQRDQAKLLKSIDQSIAKTSKFPFEESYTHVGETINGSGYATDYDNEALMLPDTNAHKAGGGLHTYVGKYNYFTGSAAATDKKLVRGWRRGSFAGGSNLSPLYLYAAYSPSAASSNFGVGTCCRISES